MVEKTLQCMYKGGIYDHIGYGFSRYSTDAKWLVPHFEKMLYDNALLASTYLEAYQYTKKPLYKTIATQILEFIRREMTDREGGFYSAQDADSEGVEGKYYVFKPEEITAVLQNDDASFFCNYFNISKDGNFEDHLFLIDFMPLILILITKEFKGYVIISIATVRTAISYTRMTKFLHLGTHL